MKRIKKCLLATVLAVALVVTSFIGSVPSKVFASDDLNLTPRIKVSGSMPKYEVAAGSTIDLKIPVKAVNYQIYDPEISFVDLDNNTFSEDSGFTLTYGSSAEKTLTIGAGETLVNVSLKVKDIAKAGTYSLKLKFATVDGYDRPCEVTLSTPIKVTVTSEKAAPQVVVSAAKYPDSLKKGQKFNAAITLKNVGDLTAKDVKVSLNGFGDEGIVPEYTASVKKIDSLKGDGTYSLTLPLTVSANATKGLKTVNVSIKYTDASGTASEETNALYFNVADGSAPSTDGSPNVVISNVTQSNSSPVAGGSVKVSFDLKNKSSIDMKDIKISVSNLSATSFSPVKSEPYQYIDSLPAGKTKKISMNFNISKDIAEGLNDIELQYSYKDNGGTAIGPETVKLHVLNVQNPKEASDSSTPKLIISDLDTGEETLKAGAVFTFNYQILNTHATKSANNIKVTITSEENVFSQTKGSNSFYISKIEPGETVNKSIELKIKPDATTKAYPLQIKFEYEYKGKIQTEQGPIDGSVAAEPVTESINLSVTENSRPVVSNVVVGGWDAPMVSTPTTLTFDFCNMGKAVLSNVTARVECEGLEQTGDMLFIGNVEAGTVANKEIEVTPMMEGSLNGKLIISFEDSNGNTVEVPTDFTAEIMPMVIPDMGGNDFMPELPQAKKPILNTWLFVGLEIVLFAASILIARGIRIKIYKNKLRRLEEEEI